jgi:hypothetical protein
VVVDENIRYKKNEIVLVGKNLSTNPFLCCLSSSSSHAAASLSANSNGGLDWWIFVVAVVVVDLATCSE